MNAVHKSKAAWKKRRISKWSSTKNRPKWKQPLKKPRRSSKKKWRICENSPRSSVRSSRRKWKRRVWICLRKPKKTSIAAKAKFLKRRKWKRLSSLRKLFFTWCRIKFPPKLLKTALSLHGAPLEKQNLKKINYVQRFPQRAHL